MFSCRVLIVFVSYTSSRLQHGSSCSIELIRGVRGRIAVQCIIYNLGFFPATVKRTFASHIIIITIHGVVIIGTNGKKGVEKNRNEFNTVERNVIITIRINATASDVRLVFVKRVFKTLS